jgi:hypothetical protein
MASGIIVTNSGKKLVLNRAFKASPTYTTPSVFKVGTGITTPAVTDTNLQTPVIISGTSYTKTFVGGYPILDEANLNITTRCLLLTTEANGNSLTEFGIFNTDGTLLCFSRTVHAPITKNTSVQVVYIEKDKII